MSFHNKLYSKLLGNENFQAFVDEIKSTNAKIVFTNGCFDILHRGHVEYLCHARDFGDKLIIGLNTDSSVKRQNKSPERPINDEKTRALILSALECVDAIILFDEETPYELIKLIQPDILVKGSDYKVTNIVGYDIVTAKGGKVCTVPLIENFSTTKLIQKLRV